jgi:hypothetical protein
MADLAYFRQKYPAFAALDDSKVQFHLDDVLPMLEVSRWGNIYDRGHAALAAHELQLSLLREQDGQSGGGGGLFPLTSKSVGDVSFSFGAPSFNNADDAYYQSTTYGQDYVTMRDMVGIGAVAAV